jgi:hypothetical protein
MRGDKYGVVEKIQGDTVSVKLDKSKKVVKFPETELEVIGMPGRDFPKDPHGKKGSK